MFGSHLSISGGMHKAVIEAESLAMATVQVFTKNQQQWKVKPLEEDVIAAWKKAIARVKFEHAVSHDSYLINLASPADELWEKSIDLFVEEITRCDLLGIPWLVTHPGAHVESGEEAGIKRVAKALDKIHARLPKSKTITCLESTAGQGTTLGYKLEHLAEIIAKVKHPERLGVCVDTAHLFAAGYDFRGTKYKSLCKEIEKTIGLDRVKVWHLNDSKKPLGSRVDRHEHIGLGTIGDDGFKPIVSDKRWKNIPKILETPKDTHSDGRPWDAVNLERLASLMA